MSGIKGRNQTLQLYRDIHTLSYKTVLNTVKDFFFLWPYFREDIILDVFMKLYFAICHILYNNP